MDFNHLTLFVNDVALWRDRFVRLWGGQPTEVCSPHPAASLLFLGQVPLLLRSPQQPGDRAWAYLQQHPGGIGDVAFRVHSLEHTLERVLRAGGTLLEPVQMDPQGRGIWCQIQGWGPLRHTLVESNQPQLWVPGQGSTPIPACKTPTPTRFITALDHAVVNVPAGQLPAAIAWYQDQLGFQPQQQFAIDTAWSGLRSQVLAHPEGGAQLPINEPTTPNSQVQEFLDWHRGPGIQHVALHTSDIFQTVQQLQNAGVCFLDVPEDYYATLSQRQGYRPDPCLEAAIARLKILVDWDTQLPQARLLQTFTQPIFGIPTLFFELIQRQRIHWQGIEQGAPGFGERNFQALFEAIEREQRKRGSLT